MNDLKLLQKDYVRLLIHEGVNLQSGQDIVITCPVDQAWFGRLCAEEAYACGCREVIMNWTDEALSRMKYLNAADEVFDSFAPWTSLLYNTKAEDGAAWLVIECGDPELLKGVDPDRIQRSQIASGKAIKRFRDLETSNGFPWCIGAIPSPEWSAKVFPDLSPADAEARMWEEILKAARADRGSAVADWSAHSDELQEHVRILNEYNFKSLHYKNSLGTDLSVELPEGHFWAGGREKCGKNGMYFSANIPTEEVFTLPKRDGVNGTVAASKPLSLNGNLIDGFRFTLKGGKITEIHAETGEDILRRTVEVDEGAAFFGEVALVPYHSPISNSGILFYNTLFDENASCHFAFGEAYPCIKGADGMSEDELKERGVNSSIVHVDFMVGTPDLSIVGTTHDGKEIPVFIDGDFAF